ncbi:hypothetical protein ACWEWQ_25165, partial [Streptomyces sp. NPDC003832]
LLEQFDLTDAAETPAAARELAAVEYASMALVTLAYRRSRAGLPAQVPPQGRGELRDQPPPGRTRTTSARVASRPRRRRGCAPPGGCGPG